MKIGLGQVVDEPVDWQETLEIRGEDLGHPEVLDVGEVRCRGRLSPMSPGYLLQISLDYEQTLRCDRCLGPVTVPVTSEVDLLLLLHDGEEEKEERELAGEDLGIRFLEEEELDTRPISIEQLHLGVPMKPLCRDDCAGLCGTCGADLNPGPCDCRSAGDPRWSALAALAADRSD